MKQTNCNDKLDKKGGDAGTTVGNGATGVTDTQINTSALINAVVESYENTASFKKTAADLKISTAKVRKALLTAGVWTNETADSIAKAREAHPDWSDQQIADELHISLNAVQMYTPYKLGPYAGDSASAERNARYREKNRAAADSVDGNRREMAELFDWAHETTSEEATDDFSDPAWQDKAIERDLAKGLPFSSHRYNSDPNAMPYVDDQFYLDYRKVEHASYFGRGYLEPCVYRIRLEIDTKGMDAEELGMLHREYGVRSGWYRDLLIPSNMPLHYLHYVIQRAFGFENKADHIFQYPDSVFESLVWEGGKAEYGSLHNYARLCGVLFRFPFGNDSEMYWDDDYDGRKSIRTWLREKYSGSRNINAGTGYSYSDNQYRIWQWLGDRVIDFHKLEPALDETNQDKVYAKLAELGAPDEYTLGEMSENDISDVQGWQFPVNNVLESLELEQVLSLIPQELTFDDMESNLETPESELLEKLLMLEKAREAMAAADDTYKVLQKRMKAGQWGEDDILVKRWRKSAEDAASLFEMSHGGAEPSCPFTRELLYLYDFGGKKGGFVNPDGMEGSDTFGFKNTNAKWKIKIRIVDAFADNSEYYHRNYSPRDARGVNFHKDPEHGEEMAERLIKMCHWKEKLEILDSKDNEVKPSNEADMMLELKPEQIMLPEERTEIEEYKAEQEEIQQRRAEWWGEEIKPHTVVIDDKLYAALKTVMTEWVPVCIGKEGADPGEGYPDVKIRNSSIEKQV